MHEVAYLFDVDNTLLDNDRVIADWQAHLVLRLGEVTAARYNRHLEALRESTGYVDYLHALQCLRDAGDDPMDSDAALGCADFLLDYPFAERLYPASLAVLARAGRLGPTAILSDGDLIVQPRKVARSGLGAAVDGRVMIFAHKELSLDVVAARLPAQRYVMVDDKLRLLAAMKARWGERLTTVFVRQGHYALDSAALRELPPADRVIDGIGEMAALLERGV